MIHIMGEHGSKLTNVQPGDVQPNAVDLRLDKVFQIKTDRFVLSEEEKKSIDFSKLTPEQIRVAEGVLSEAEKNGVDANYFLISAYKKNHFSQPLPPYPSREQTAAERILWERENFNNMPNGVTAVTFADGERLSITTFRYTQDELITAYQRAKPEIDTVKREALSEYALTIARAYFLPLFALYFSGWSIAWIRKGFNNARQDK